MSFDQLYGLKAISNIFLENLIQTHYDTAITKNQFFLLPIFIDKNLKFGARTSVSFICFYALAIQAFRRLRDCGSVIAIQKMMNIEEKQALYGNVCVFLGEFNRGQEYFLASSRPEAALEVRFNRSSMKYFAKQKVKLF